MSGARLFASFPPFCPFCPSIPVTESRAVESEFSGYYTTLCSFAAPHSTPWLHLLMRPEHFAAWPTRSHVQSIPDFAFPLYGKRALRNGENGQARDAGHHAACLILPTLAPLQKVQQA